MPERPHLLFPALETHSRERERRGRSELVHLPGRTRQIERLGPRFEALERATLTPRATADGVAPEDVLVFELVGNVDEFISVARRTGLDLLMAIDEELAADDDFYPVKTGRHAGERKEGLVEHRTYLTASSAQALRQVVALWRRWGEGRPFDRGYSRWDDVFAHLKDVRPWDARDRVLETGLLEDWRLRLEHGQRAVPVEVELFYAASPAEREAREGRVRATIAEGGGEVIERSEIPDIRYHALLAHLPAGRAEAILEQVSALRERGIVRDALVQEVGVQFLRPAGQVSTPLVLLEGEHTDDAPIDGAPAGSPVVALLDGLPLQNHRRLADRLIVDDPDGYEGEYQAHERQHGTAMASLILWGDIRAGEASLRRPIYVRPVMRPQDAGWAGSPREEQIVGLSVDFVHRAVRRIFEGDAGELPVAPSVRVINLSIGERDRPFLGSMSPMARLIDWLTVRYGVLFVVSAGNDGDDPILDGAETAVTMTGDPVDAERLERALLADGVRRQRHRRILAPAESLNALSVGARNHDHSGGELPPQCVPSLGNPDLPAIYSRSGPGYRRSVKPDVLHSGGGVALAPPVPAQNGRWRVHRSGRFPPGHLVASPGQQGSGGLDQTVYRSGTSNAAALTSRAADRLYDVLWSLRRGPRGGILDQAPEALWLKALIVHSTSWPPEAVEVVRRVLAAEGVDGRKMRSALMRVFGFGVVREERVLTSDEHRATLLGAGTITHDDVHRWTLPLPPSLAGRAGHRRLSVTLAWFTPPPITLREQRSIKLSFRAPNYQWVARNRQANNYDVQRGTVQHEVFEGDEATVFAPEYDLTIDVQCDDRDKSLRDHGQTIAVPYALIATLDVAEALGLPIYEEIQTAVELRTQVRVGT